MYVLPSDASVMLAGQETGATLALTSPLWPGTDYGFQQAGGTINVLDPGGLPASETPYKIVGAGAGNGSARATLSLIGTLAPGVHMLSMPAAQVAVPDGVYIGAGYYEII